MLSFDFGVDNTRFGELSLELRLTDPSRRSASSATAFAALSQTALASRFAPWAGLSGKTYVFSVYTPSACPAFCDAILMAVARNDRGERRILRAVDTGDFPEPILARVVQEVSSLDEQIEFQVHLLARSPAERRAALADLQAACADPALAHWS